MEMSSCSEHDQQVVQDVVKKKRSEVVPGARCLVAGCQAHQPGTQVPGTLAGEPDTWVPGHLAPGTWAPGHVGGVSGTWLGCLAGVPGTWHLAGVPGTWHMAGVPGTWAPGHLGTWHLGTSSQVTKNFALTHACAQAHRPLRLP